MKKREAKRNKHTKKLPMNIAVNEVVYVIYEVLRSHTDRYDKLKYRESDRIQIPIAIYDYLYDLLSTKWVIHFLRNRAVIMFLINQIEKTAKVKLVGLASEEIIKIYSFRSKPNKVERKEWIAKKNSGTATIQFYKFHYS